jgi:hypothetical protein
MKDCLDKERGVLTCIGAEGRGAEGGRDVGPTWEDKPLPSDPNRSSPQTLPIPHCTPSHLPSNSYLHSSYPLHQLCSLSAGLPNNTHTTHDSFQHTYGTKYCLIGQLPSSGGQF